MSIKANIQAIEEIKARHAEISGRASEDVLLLAVTKLHGADEINEAIECGITDIGENKVQEIIDKYEKLKPVRIHLIGHLQTNKVKYIIDKVHMIHSVDSLRLAQEINKRAEQHDLDMNILIQVNVAHDENKFGIDKDELEQLLGDISSTCPRLKVKGLMSIVPYAEDLEEVRPYFQMAKKLFDQIKEKEIKGVDFQFLSMGMSNDFTVAIEEGSNIIRVGTAIFGERDYR